MAEEANTAKGVWPVPQSLQKARRSVDVYHVAVERHL